MTSPKDVTSTQRATSSDMSPFERDVSGIEGAEPAKELGSPSIEREQSQLQEGGGRATKEATEQRDTARYFGAKFGKGLSGLGTIVFSPLAITGILTVPVGAICGFFRGCYKGKILKNMKKGAAAGMAISMSPAIACYELRKCAKAIEFGESEKWRIGTKLIKEDHGSTYTKDELNLDMGRIRAGREFTTKKTEDRREYQIPKDDKEGGLALTGMQKIINGLDDIYRTGYLQE